MSNCHQSNSSSSSSDALAAAIAAQIARNQYSFTSTSITAKVPVSSASSSTNAAMSKNNSSSDVLSETECDVDVDHPDNNENDDDENNNSNSNDNEDNYDDAERRLARSRERNREHARRTRRRKKAQLEILQEKVKVLQGKNKSLKQSLEECTIASILVGFSGTDGDVDSSDHDDATIQSLIKEATELESKDIFKTIVGGTRTGIGGKRKRFVSDASELDIATAVDADVDADADADCSSPSSAAATTGNDDNSTVAAAAAAVSFPLKLEINGRIVLIGGDGRTHINWKTGIYTDDNGARSQLTKQQLESLRRERNRIHAKMTRDRKKSFIATIEKTIEELESSNQRMNAVLKDVKSQSPSLSTKLSTYASASASMTFSKKKLEEEKNIDTINVGSSNSLLPRAVSLSDLVENENDSSDGSNTSKLPSKKLKIIHGFSLQY